MKKAAYLLFIVAVIILGALILEAEEQKVSEKRLAMSVTIAKAKDFSSLVGMQIFSDTLIKNHIKLYEGYVKNSNDILEKLNNLILDKKDRTPEYAELKRRFAWELNGMVLHEYYFENLGPSAPLDAKSPLYIKISEDFGSFDDWKEDFISTGLMRGIGWAVLSWELKTGKLLNIWINEHDVGHITSSRPILVMDVFEHAYITDFGLDRAKYIESFFKNINWKISEKRFNEFYR